MWEKETQYYKNRSSRDINGTKPIDATPTKHLQNANLKNTTEFENALIKTLNTGIHTVAENVDHDSSSLTGGVAAATNLILQQELEKNYDSFDAIMLSHGSSGHGYTLNFSTDHELTMADSNTDNVGPAKDRPLQNRRNSGAEDPIPQFSEDKLIGDDYEAQINRLRYQRFTNSGYRTHSRDEWSDKIRFDLEKLPSFYEEAVLSENGQLYMENVRPAIATLANMHEHDHFSDDEYVSVISTPSELPTLQDYESLDAYAEELTDNHIEIFDSEDEYEEATMASDGYNP